MPSKFAKSPRGARQLPARHVGRRCHRDDVHRREFARDDPRTQFEAAADRGVETLADDVDPAVVEVPVGHDGRVAGQEVAQQRHQEIAAEGLAHAHLQGAGRRLVAASDAGQRALQRCQRVGDLGQEALAVLGERQASRAAMKEPHPEVRFEAGDVLADAGRRQAEHSGRGRETAVFRRLHERRQMLEMSHARS